MTTRKIAMTHGQTRSKRIDKIINAPVEVSGWIDPDGLTLAELEQQFNTFASDHGIPVGGVRIRSSHDYDYTSDFFLVAERPPTEREKEQRRKEEHKRLEKARAVKAKREAAERREFDRLRKKYEKNPFGV